MSDSEIAEFEAVFTECLNALIEAIDALPDDDVSNDQ